MPETPIDVPLCCTSIVERFQVARDQLSEIVGGRLHRIQSAVRRRVGFLPWAVERAVNDLVGLCSAVEPSDSNIEKGFIFGGGGSSTSSRSSFST